jgi:hypothetical protein
MNSEARPAGDARKNLGVILLLVGVFMAMGLSLLGFLLLQRQRVQSAEYQGLESLLQAPAGTALHSGMGNELRPRSEQRPEGAQSTVKGAPGAAGEAPVEPADQAAGTSGG